MLHGIEPGELGKWLRVVLANSAPGARPQAVPSPFAEHLVNLRVARKDANGQLTITDKGRLAVRMDAPDALHKQVDPDEIVAGSQDEMAPSQTSENADDHPPARAFTASTFAPYDGEDDDHGCGHGCTHDHHR